MLRSDGAVDPLVFLESSDIGATYCAAAARALGLAPLFLCDLAGYDGDPRARLAAEPHRQLDTSRLETVLAALREVPGMDRGALLTLVDARLVVASDAARALRIAGLDPAVVALKSKTFVAALVPEASPTTIGLSRHAVPHEALRELLAETGAIIVKPDAGAGAAGVFTIRSKEELDAIDARLAQASAGAHVASAVSAYELLAQAFVPGVLVSLEGFASSGEVRVLGITDRQKIGATECRASFPIDDTLSATLRRRMDDAVRALLSRAGFEDGYFHVEFIVDGERAWMIDANVGRLGGGPVGELLAFAFDVAPEDVYRHVLATSLGRSDGGDPYARPLRRAASVLYGLREGGALIGVDLPSPSGTRHTQILGTGARVTPMGTDDWSWVGILSGLPDDLARATASLRIRTEHGVEAPCF